MSAPEHMITLENKSATLQQVRGCLRHGHWAEGAMAVHTALPLKRGLLPTARQTLLL